MLALSPVFITYSSLVMSDVPDVVRDDLLRSDAGGGDARTTRLNRRSWMRMSAWLMFGLFAGFSTIIRPTNATILVGLAVCVVMVPLGEARSVEPAQSGDRSGNRICDSGCVAVASERDQSRESHSRADTAWWVPEVYGAGGKTFSAAYLFGPTMPRNPHGNVLVYVTTLLGLDGMLGDRGDARYFLYPFAAAVFAIVGFVAIFRAPERSAARRLMWFGLGYLAALTGLYCFYLFTDVAFILPGAFILFIAAGAGAAAANRYMRDVFKNPNRKPLQAGGRRRA